MTNQLSRHEPAEQPQEQALKGIPDTEMMCLAGIGEA
jgi:hypothetical protein